MKPLARLSAAAITGAAKALTGARSMWLGCAPVPQQRIYFANHSSHSDFVLLWASLPPLLRQRTRPVAGADYWSKGVVRPFVIHQVFNGVLVDRTGQSARPVGGAAAPDVSGEDSATAATETVADPKASFEHAKLREDNFDPAVAFPESESETPAATIASDAPEVPSETPATEQPASGEPASGKPDALLPLKKALDAGDSLIIFPEGTRNLEEALLPFKSGLYHLAQAYPQVEIVPVWLGNLNRVMPKGALIPLPLLCTVSFGAPIQLEQGEDKASFLSRARNALVALGGREEATA